MATPERISPEERSRRVKRLAHDVGFDLVGIAPPEVPVAFERFQSAMDRGYGAEMDWLIDATEARRDVREVHPTARAVVSLGVSYASDTPGYLEDPPGPGEGWIARYAQGRDYHVTIKKMLVQLARRLEAEPGLGHPSQAHRVFVDTGPVLEKAFAAEAGVGWIGKNSLLLNRELGSWIFLAVILTPLELAFDMPATDHCGTCTRCLDVCPTDAFPEPYLLDARRCIAYWTIEAPDPAAVIEPDMLGRHLFGCDLCQEVCPWNREVPPTRHQPLAPRPENHRPSLRGLEDLDEAGMRARFPRSAVRRVSPEQMGAVVRLLGRDDPPS